MAATTDLKSVGRKTVWVRVPPPLPTLIKMSNKNKISDHLEDYQYGKAILWLLTIPKEELSDSMLESYKQMQEQNQNEIWLINHFEKNLSEEIREFIEWNGNMF